MYWLLDLEITKMVNNVLVIHWHDRQGDFFLCKIELHILLPKKFKITCDFLDPKLVLPFLVSKFKIDFKKKYSYSRGTTQI